MLKKLLDRFWLYRQNRKLKGTGFEVRKADDNYEVPRINQEFDTQEELLIALAKVYLFNMVEPGATYIDELSEVKFNPKNGRWYVKLNTGQELNYLAQFEQVEEDKLSPDSYFRHFVMLDMVQWWESDFEEE